MKTWILHDSHFGNGEKIALVMKDVLSQAGTVSVGKVTEVSPETVVGDRPDVVIVGAAVRKFMTSRTTKNWIRGLSRELEKQGTQIDYGAAFLTHGMPDRMIAGRGERLRKALARVGRIRHVYPQWLSARVEKPEGPLVNGSLDACSSMTRELIGWMESGVSV